jgi:hypothetical protein
MSARRLVAMVAIIGDAHGGRQAINDSGATRHSAILNVLATAAQVDPEAAELLAQIRRQRYTGQSGIVDALRDACALDSDLDTDEAKDIVYALLSPEVHLILTVERDWPADRYERWIARSLRTLLGTG